MASIDPAAARVRAYRPGDERALSALFAQVFGRPMTEPHWRWKLASRPSAAPAVFVGLDSSDLPVSQCAAIPIRCAGPAGDVPALVAVDAMTAPEHRRQGRFTEVSRRAYGEWRAAGYAFVIGLPNEQWRSRTAALGWAPVAALAWRVRPLRPGRLLARRFGRAAAWMAAVDLAWRGHWQFWVRPDPRVVVREVTSPEIFDRLPRAGARGSFSVVRDREWMGWRYFAAPDVRYRVTIAERDGAPAGYCVTRTRDDGGRPTGYIAELAAAKDDRRIYRTLLVDAVTALDREGVELVAAAAIPGSFVDSIYRRAGFLFSWGRFDVQAVPLAMDGPIAFSDLHAGDFDVV